MLKFLIFLKFKRYNAFYIGNSGKNAQSCVSEIFSKFNFIIGIFIQEPKLSEFYSDGVNAFCLCPKYVRRSTETTHADPLNFEPTLRVMCLI